ncbi:parB-like partition protein [Psychromonas sp. CNPT3]|uniref:ParB/RepB/Spo0J family partition protein n=1 Tax=Psychromonas sp. CNPT3 TaxID=314282 RepID=UPI00006E50C1|nr:ParB/RepB/Spo0J family partition protein [Psychromonas sp. CNPT3]AGH79984.1 parB-like partition protein [Psychromonas sp. CNPT3]
MIGRKRGLGKGLDSLLSSSNISRSKQVSHDVQAEKTQKIVESTQGELQNINIDLLQAGKYQPRRHMCTEKLEELASSIHAQGIIQPLVVRLTGHQNYEIIAGERRWRAAKIVGLESIPCLVKNVQDNAAIAIALIENIQREDLNAMEEAIAYKRLLEEFTLTHQDVAVAVGKSRTAVSNLLRLNNLSMPVQKMLANGDIEMGHARALLSCDDERQASLAFMVIDKNLTVRETERLVKQSSDPKVPKSTPKLLKTDPKIQAISETLSSKLGTPVVFSQAKNGSGKIVISFDKTDKLNDILALLK